MTRLIWDSVGSRQFETGVDRGVLYTTTGFGIPWNGLTSVKENASGGEAREYFVDGFKYLQVANTQDFTGTIEAFTYPNEFAVHDGSFVLTSGLTVTQQVRRPFGLSYRTRIGNDVRGSDHGYKIHIVYNVLAQPSDKSYSSLGEQVAPSNFSWNFTTRPEKPISVNPVAPLAHVIIDSTKVSSIRLRIIEEWLYGSPLQPPRLISMNDLFALFDAQQVVFSIFANETTGLSQLLLETDNSGDLYGENEEGLYMELSETRLAPTAIAGLYSLES